MPFDEDDSEETNVRTRPGIKAPKGKSMFDNLPKKPSKAEFERQASEANDKLNSYRERAGELSIAYKKVLDDKTLPENKTIISKEIEVSVIDSLGQLAIDMNTDEHEVEGMGSVGINSLLLRCLLFQRDRLNLIEYTNRNLENKIKDLETRLQNFLSLVDKKKDSE